MPVATKPPPLPYVLFVGTPNQNRANLKLLDKRRLIGGAAESGEDACEAVNSVTVSAAVLSRKLLGDGVHHLAERLRELAPGIVIVQQGGEDLTGKALSDLRDALQSDSAQQLADFVPETVRGSRLNSTLARSLERGSGGATPSGGRFADVSPELKAKAAAQDLERSRFFIRGKSPVMDELRKSIDAVSRLRVGHVLILGPTGTGKELVARGIWAKVSELLETEVPFVSFNAAGLTAELADSELFGYEKGSHSTASQSKAGLFVMAAGGFLFIDEVGELSLAAQTKLLRAIEYGLVKSVGGTEIRVEVRVLAATNRDLQAMVAAGTFREDLYFRLCKVTITTPALAEHPQDTPELAINCLERWCRANGKTVISSFTPGALAILENASFPGNVRDLEGVVESLATQSLGSVIDAGDVILKLATSVAADKTKPFPPGTYDEKTDTFQRELIQTAVLRAGSVKGGAELLGIERSRLYRELERLGLEGVMKRGPKGGSDSEDDE